MDRLKELFNSLRGIISRWPEVWSLPVALLAFFASMYLLRYIDPTSGLFDTGILQVLIVVLVLLPALSSAAFAGIKFNFPVMYHYYKKQIITKDWLKIEPWQRLTFLFVLYLSLWFGGALLVSAFM